MVVRKLSAKQVQEEILSPAYTHRMEVGQMPKYRIPDHGAMPDVAERMINDELMLDGNARLNLATFVTTWMEPQAERLMTASFDKNMIDKDEYPATAEIETRCVNIVADLFNAPAEGDAIGVSTTGSSEAVMLGGLALKWDKHLEGVCNDDGVCESPHHDALDRRDRLATSSTVLLGTGVVATLTGILVLAVFAPDEEEEPKVSLGPATGPTYAGRSACWNGGRWCRGAGDRAGFGFDGHGWRHGCRASGLPGWTRRGRGGGPWSVDRHDGEEERRDLEWRAGQLDAELRWIRRRLDELRGEQTATS